MRNAIFFIRPFPVCWVIKIILREERDFLVCVLSGVPPGTGLETKAEVRNVKDRSNLEVRAGYRHWVF